MSTHFRKRFYPYAISIDFYNHFVLPITNMLVDIAQKVPRGVRMLIDHLLSQMEIRYLAMIMLISIYFKKFSIIRFFGCLQPPHVFLKYIPQRLGQLEFF